MLGAAYEYLIKYFADSAGKKGGEFYTPGQVVRLLVTLLKPQEGMEIYDPTVGSGGMLIQSLQYVEEQGQNTRNLNLYGQESNPTTWIICRMNMILHNISSATIEDGDTLEDPKILEDNKGTFKKFDIIGANPPFSQNYSKANMKFQKKVFVWFCTGNRKESRPDVCATHGCQFETKRKNGYHYASWCVVSRRYRKINSQRIG